MYNCMDMHACMETTLLLPSPPASSLPYPRVVCVCQGMGARSGYSIATGLVVLLLCVINGGVLVLHALPVEAAIGVLFWVGVVITAQVRPFQHAVSACTRSLKTDSAETSVTERNTSTLTLTHSLTPRACVHLVIRMHIIAAALMPCPYTNQPTDQPTRPSTAPWRKKAFP